MRKLLIARALSLDPELLVLDEAFDGLDAASRRRFAVLVDRLMGEGLQMLVISHRRSEIPAGITHVVALDAGRIVFAGPLSEWRGRDLETPGLGEIPEDRLSTLHCEVSGGEEIIRLEGVTVRYGGRIVFRDLDWKVRSGENWMLSGPNGAGKTTLVRLVSGDHPQAYSNRIFLFGRRRGSGETIWEIRNRIGLVSADLQVRYRRQLIGLDVVASGFFDSIGLYRRAAKSQYEQASRWMARLCIPHLAEPRFDRMSTGERRMVLLARAMVKKPDLLILDEPCQGLDARHRRCFLDVVDRIAACSRTTLLYITHHGDERPRCISHELHLPPA
jgi:molybdate transport system ATP-binding protein